MRRKYLFFMNIISNKGIFQMENGKFSPKQKAEIFWVNYDIYC